MCRAALSVDMLWVIDNSFSMEEEQENLAQNFPVLLDVLTNPPDDDGDGNPDVPPVEDLRVGIITTDLGSGDTPDVIGCPQGNGDNGELVRESRATDAECDGRTTGDSPWLQFDGTNAEQFTSDFACLARLGTDGCGNEQPLEASLRALTDNVAPGGPNEGFLRDDSIVAIVYLTDEDDCSVQDDAIFSATPEAEEQLGPTGTRCAQHPEFLHAVDRYTGGLAALAENRTGDILVSAISGIPRDITRDQATCLDIDGILADERLQTVPDPDQDEKQLTPACEFGGVGSAPPARRILEAVKPFSNQGDGAVKSICSPDLRPAIQEIAELVQNRLCDLL